MDIVETLDAGNLASFVPKGNSMWPILKGEKNIVIIKKHQEYLLGEVYLYRYKGVLLLHRLINVDGDILTFRGDSQKKVENIKKSDVIGIMVGFYCGKKYIDCSDKRYKKRVNNWHKRAFIKRVRLRLFGIRCSIENKLKREKNV